MNSGYYFVLSCKYWVLLLYAAGDFILNPASGGASAGVWGRNPGAVKIMLNESFNSTLIVRSVS